jgi:hypothetical protein
MPHQEPSNPRLWQMIIVQARARFAKYPSPGASHWVHDQYIKHGGQFVDVSARTRQQKMAKMHLDAKKREMLARRGKEDDKNTAKKKGAK